MEKEFIPYEEALALKELGFDEPCLKFWNCSYERNDNTKTLSLFKNEHIGSVNAPLYQQAFRWLLNIRQDLCLSFWCDGSGKCTDSSPYDDSVFEFNTELECLKKLIECVYVVKNK
jgi:hypothetical protein